jgi:hypothetical protein
MDIRNPIVIRMAMLLEELDEGPLRAAYMVVSSLHELQMRNGGGSNDNERERTDRDDKGKRRSGKGTDRCR